MRPFNCFLLSMCVIVGMIADQGLDTFSHWPAMIMAFIGAWSLSAAAMIINDYFDRKIDDINQPERSIPAGEIKANIALMVGIILVVIGILMSVGIDLYEKIAQDGVFGVSLVTGIISAILLFSYTNYLKRYSLLGNFAVSICVWFGFTYGDLVFDFQLNIFPECLGFSAFVLNFGREIAKGIIDIEGDKEYNVTTVATVLGKRWTAIISAIFYILAISTTVIPIVLAGASWLYLST
ncbi:MAG: geranylgeranylglycerol-phosphate geranylgeranyltransferase, partial [Asgard group archaeon]|nr:geranylgeranylglycerol-phosphate geranylgeranyltransferase [Asgard group archaeon]